MSSLFALLSSVLWGTSDYLGGTATRRAAAAWVLFIGQSCALAVLLGYALASGSLRADDALLWGSLGGLIGPIALVSFYTALSTGTMGVVAPVASCGVVVPVVLGLAEGEHPGPLKFAGIVVTVIGVLLAGRASGGAAGSGQGRAVLLAVVAAVGFGGVLFCIAEGTRSSAATTLVLQRAVNILLMSSFLLARRPSMPTATPVVWLCIVSGLGDMAANASYAYSVGHGLVSVNAVLSSLYPVVTALLARRIDRERLSREQLVGVGVSLAGVLTLAVG